MDKRDDQMDGAAMIMTERDRQTREEGWTAAHDDKHKDGELLAAALCVLDPDANPWPWGENGEPPPKHKDWDPIERLIVGGAFIAAEIDRRLRAEAMAQRKEDKPSARERRHCNHPDRDNPRIECGYPLPCPYHTIVTHSIDESLDFAERIQKGKAS